MKNKLNPITKLGAFAAVCVFGTGLASAATTYSKGGVQSTGYSQGFADDGLPMLAPGVQSFDIGGYLSWDGPTSYGVQLSYGRFVTSNVQVGVQAALQGVNSDKDYGIGLFAEYNFLTGSKWVPYVGANVGYVNPSGGSHSAAIGVDAGVKYFMRSNLAIFAEVGGSWLISGDRGRSDGFRKELIFGTTFYF